MDISKFFYAIKADEKRMNMLFNWEQQNKVPKDFNMKKVCKLTRKKSKYQGYVHVSWSKIADNHFVK